jgi:hypothetical protein
MKKEYRISNNEFRMLKYETFHAAQALALRIALAIIKYKK